MEKWKFKDLVDEYGDAVITYRSTNSKKLKYVQSVLEKYDLKEWIVWIGEFNLFFRQERQKFIFLSSWDKFFSYYYPISYRTYYSREKRGRNK